MKRLLIVLFGVLVFQGSVWAQFDGWSTSCRKVYPIGSDDGAKILYPVSENLEIKKKAPFLLQWKGFEVSQTVNIRLYKKGAEDKDLFGKRLNNRPNTGTAVITKQDFKKAKVKAGEQYFFQVELIPTRSEKVISSECFTFNVKQKEDLQCNNTTTVKDCLQALIDQNKQIHALVEENSNRLDALEAGGGTVGGGDKPDEDGSGAVSADGAGGDGGAKYPIKFGGITIVQGTEWSKVVIAAQGQVDSIPSDINACWCHGQGNPVDYCKAEGWAVGVNGYDMTDKDFQASLRGAVTEHQLLVASGLDLPYTAITPTCIGK